MPARHVTGCISLQRQKHRNITNKINNLSDFYQNRLQNIICFLLFEIYRHICQSTKKENDNQLIVAKMVLNENMAKYKTIPVMKSQYPSASSLHHTGLKLYVIAVFC